MRSTQSNSQSTEAKKAFVASSWRWTCAGLAMMWVAMVNTAHGDTLPRPSVTAMCAEAVVVVEGESLGDGRIKVSKAYKGADRVGADGILLAPDLQNCPRKLGWNGEDGELSTQHAVVFLYDPPVDEGIAPWDPDAPRQHTGKLKIIGVEGLSSGGCPGVYWLQGDACYGYTQPMNPGDYALSAGKHPWEPTTPADLRQRIETGLAVARQWEEALAQKDPKEAAKALAPFLRRSTWPKGYSDEFPVRRKLARLRDDAVPVVIDAIREGMAGQENVDTAVLSLCDVGKAARLAVPALLELLAKPGPTSRYYICCALKAAADPQGISAVRPLLESTDMQVAVSAAEALGAMGDVTSFGPIAKLLPADTDVRNWSRASDILRVLYRLDVKRAGPLIRRYADAPALREVRDHFNPAGRQR